MCKLIMDPTNLVQKFQQKQLIVFSFPATLWGVFVLLIMLVWTRGPVWITSGGREYGGGEKLHGTWCTGKPNKHSTVYTRITHSDAQFFTVLEWGNADSLRFVQTSFVGNHFIRYHSALLYTVYVFHYSFIYWVACCMFCFCVVERSLWIKHSWFTVLTLLILSQFNWDLHCCCPSEPEEVKDMWMKMVKCICYLMCLVNKKKREQAKSNSGTFSEWEGN